MGFQHEDLLKNKKCFKSFGGHGSQKIECDLEKDGSLDELEVQIYKDDKCDKKDGKKIDVKPFKCGKNPW